MRKTTTLILLVLALASVIAPASAMIGGTIDEDNVHPNVGAIMMKWPNLDVPDDFVGRLCTATLIHEQALLTAAHCHKYVVNQGITFEDDIWVTFHHDPFDDEAAYHEVGAFIPHPLYQTEDIFSYDVALLILKEPVVGIEPQPWPTDIGYMDDLLDALKGQGGRELEMVVVGYGNSEVGLRPPAVQLDAIRRFGTVALDQLLETKVKSSNRNPENVSLWNGDSGGPLFHLDQHGNQVLVGVLSHCGLDSTIHYRVDTDDAQEFINTTLDANFPAE